MVKRFFTILLIVCSVNSFAIDLCKTVKSNFSGIYFFCTQKVKDATPIGETIPPATIKQIVQNTAVSVNNSFYNLTKSDVNGCGGINSKNKIEQYIYDVLPEN